MSHSTSIEEAINNGHQDYWDQEQLDLGRSGGSRCPKCRKWGTTCRKRKNHHPTWLTECKDCEIDDPFQRMWHHFNRYCDNEKRDIYNAWLREVRENLSNIYGCSETSTNQAKSKLKELIEKVPFFGV